MASPFLSGFLDGFTGAGLFTRLRRPGAPTQLFADPGDRSFDPLIQRVLRERAAKGEGSDSSYIVRRYPQLFDLGSPDWFQGIGEGWLVIIARLCQRLEPIASEDFKMTGVTTGDSLRIVYRGGDEGIGRMIEAARVQALTTCEVCGAAGEQGEKDGYVAVRCSECHELGL